MLLVKTAFNMQNLMNSHDATRLASAVANPRWQSLVIEMFNWSQKSNNRKLTMHKNLQQNKDK